MADLASLLLRTTARAFYPTEHILVIDALVMHSTLQDTDLAFILGMQPKALRKICGRLREDGLLTVQTRAERRTDGSGAYSGGAPGPGGQLGKGERITHRDWYYLNYHRAIDSIKFRLYRLLRHVEALGAPTTEKKELACSRCKSQYTELEVMDKIDPQTGDFLCHRCGHALDRVEEDDKVHENETMKRLNTQLDKLLQLMQRIDATTVPENDFDTALARQKPIHRTDTHPGARTEIVDTPNKNLQNTKGLELKPEKIAVQVQDDEDVRKANAEAEEQARREKEARQNALPEWISKSTISGDVTAVGAKEQRLRREREAHLGSSASAAVNAEEDSKAGVTPGADEDVLNAYWEELEKQRVVDAAKSREEDAEGEDEEEEDDDDDDGFEDVPDIAGGDTPALNGVAKGTSAAPSGVNTPNIESSNATDDERDAKRPRLEAPEPSSAPVSGAASNGKGAGNSAARPIGAVAEKIAAEGTPAASDEDEDDELEFENV